MELLDFLLENFGVGGGEIVERERDGRIVKIYCNVIMDGFDNYGVVNKEVEMMLYVSKIENGRERIVVEMWRDFEMVGVWGVIEEEYRFKNRFRNGILRNEHYRKIEAEILQFKRI